MIVPLHLGTLERTIARILRYEFQRFETLQGLLQLALILMGVQHHECPLWVISGHSATPSPMSAFGGKADIGRCLTRNHDLNVRYWG